MFPVKIDPENHEWHPLLCRDTRAGEEFVNLIARGRSLDDFLEGFPTVTREQTLAVLELGYREIVASTAKPSSA